jgi:hypothetical protein
MSGLETYFSTNRYQPTYVIGDRVFGRWNGIPFIGSVGNDSQISEEEGPRVSVLLDLPIVYNGQTRTVVLVTHRDIKPLKEF